MQCLKRCLLGVCSLMLIVAALAFAGALGLRNWLDAGDTPQPADVIVVLGGSHSRSLYAADLHRRSVAPRILLSREQRSTEDLLLEKIGVPHPRRNDVARAVLARYGVPESAIAYFDAEAMSTVDEAETVRRMLGHTADTLLIVTSAYHTRRVKMIFADVLPAARFRVVASPYESFPESWWRDQDSARNALLEVAKITYYRLGGGFRALKEGQPAAG